MSIAKSCKFLTTLLNDKRGPLYRGIFKSNTFNSKRHLHTTLNLEAIVSFNLSDIGEGIRDVVVKEWFVNVGDQVKQFDNICEVQSDKASVTITSRYDGVIKKLHHQIEGIALVGKPLVDIEVKEDDQTSSSSSSSSESSDDDIKAKEITPTLENAPEAINPNLCIPSVRRLAKEYSVNLSEVIPTGKKGRILKEDVLKYLASKEVARSILKEDVKSTLACADKCVPLTPFQKGMVKTMSEALKIPHFLYCDEVAVTKLLNLRKSIKIEAEKLGIKISLMPFFIKAASNAIFRYPILNATVDRNCENVTYCAAHNIGIAMDTKIGLAVPVIKNVDQLSILDIAKELNRLMKTGKDGVFANSDITGGTFTISNIGVIGGTYAKPIILPPQVAIIALGAAKTVPRFDEARNVVAEDIICISGAADHRIVDGASMANFVNQFKKQIEDPNLLFLNM